MPEESKITQSSETKSETVPLAPPSPPATAAVAVSSAAPAEKPPAELRKSSIVSALIVSVILFFSIIAIINRFGLSTRMMDKEHVTPTLAKKTFTPDEWTVQKDKINILLQEYTTLRTEIIQRTVVGFGLIGTVVAMTTLVTTLMKSVGSAFWRLAILGLACFVLVAAIFMVFDSIARLSKRVRAIEEEVNERAGEKLLQWESSGAKMTLRWH